MGTAAFDTNTNERLLKLLAEELKLPLLQIAREAELAKVHNDASVLGSIGYTADMALRLIDSYLLSVQLQALPSLEFEPVSVSAVLQDTAHELNILAKQYNCDLEVHVKGKHQPVMAHRRSLEAAYATLGYAFIESQPQADRPHKVILGIHPSQRGVVAGIFGNQEILNADTFRRGRALFGSASQTLPGMSSAAGAGVFVADSLLTTMEAPLRVSHHNKLAGLAATLLPSQQLQLV